MHLPLPVLLPAPLQQEPLSKSDSRILAAINVQEKHTQRLMAQADVVGTAVGLNDAGELVVKIYTAREGVANLPASLDGMNVDVEVTGIFRAMAGKPGPGGGVSHTAKQTPPILLAPQVAGVMTLRRLLLRGHAGVACRRSGGTQYVLSNYHVLEADIVNGGNGTTVNRRRPSDPTRLDRCGLQWR